MGRRIAVAAALLAIVAVPFCLRPAGPGARRAQDVVVVVTPNNEAIRHEFGRGFEAWYQARTGRTVKVDWRVLGGTSEIARLLDGSYLGSFRDLWTRRLGRPWNDEVEAAVLDDRLPASASAQARAARSAFLGSDAGCGIDVFFGGGNFDFERQAAMGTLVDGGIARSHPDWLGQGGIPESFDGNLYRDPHGRWYGCVVSCYGILYNRDALRRLGLPAPRRWSDLEDPRYVGEVALCDPTKSGSVAMAIENILQEQMRRRLSLGDGEPAAVRRGWLDGLRLVQRVGANARYFTDDSQKPPVDVADGNCAAGLCIDFYGRQQQEALRRRGAADRVGFVAPAGGTAYSVDPIGLLRGAPHAEAGRAFLEYVLSPEGQRLWNFDPGAPGGPKDFALRRLPVRRDFYERDDWKAYRSDPEADPYSGAGDLVYRPEWTSPLFAEMAFIVRVMCQDTHPDLVRAWRAIASAPEPARSRALSVLQDLSAVSYERAGGAIRQALESPDKLDAVRMAHRLADGFRTQYERAEAIAERR